MTYRQFLSIIDFKTKGKRKVLAIYGGFCIVRLDVLKVFLKRIRETEKKLLVRWVDLSEIADNPSRLFQESLHTVLVINWEVGLLNKEKTKKLLKGLGKLKCRTVILDSSDEISSVFQSIYPKDSGGFWVDCGKEPPKGGNVRANRYPMADFIRIRMGISGLLVDEEARHRLSDMTWDSLTNVFAVLEAIGETKIDLSLLQEMDLLRLNIERGMMRVLFHKGKAALVKLKLPSYNEKRFLRLVIEELILLLRAKTVVGFSLTKKASLLGMQMYPCKELLALADKFELKKLFERLYTALLLWRWREFRGISLFLLCMW